MNWFNINFICETEPAQQRVQQPLHMIKILEKGGSLSLNNSTNQFHTMLPTKETPIENI